MRNGAVVQLVAVAQLDYARSAPIDGCHEHGLD
jgi:hypothetical protein